MQQARMFNTVMHGIQAFQTLQLAKLALRFEQAVIWVAICFSSSGCKVAEVCL
jgi:hypothetical protein